MFPELNFPRQRGRYIKIKPRKRNVNLVHFILWPRGYTGVHV